MKRKLLSLLLMLTLVLSMVPAVYSAEIVNSGTCGDYLNWELDDTGNLTISGTGDMYSNIFWEDGIRTITICEGVTGIGTFGFIGLAELSSITLPSTLKSIGAGAFRGCEKLTSITFPAGLNQIGSYAFADCDSITSIHIPAVVTDIGNNAFGYMESLVEITVDGRNQNYASYDGILYTKDFAQLLQCPAGREGNIAIHTSVTLIDDYAFSGAAITGIVLPEGLKRIGEYAFVSAALETLHLPTTVEILEERIVADCNQLKEISVARENSVYCAVEGVLYTKDMTELVLCPEGMAGEFVVPTSVTQIGEGAFRGTGLTRIVLQDGVEKIQYAAFRSGDALKEVIISDSVKEIHSCAFGDNHNLEKIVFLGSAPLFSSYVFSNTATTAYYPAGDASWTEAVRQDHDGNIIWVPYNGEYPSESEMSAFTDIQAGAYYISGVNWAVANGITSGTGLNTFGPNDSCTRDQVVMFLWAANGRPTPKSTVSPFTDIQAGKYYYDAVLWAVEKGITGGAGANTFAPNRTVTRAEFVTMLWNAVGKPSVSISNPFPDVASGKWYAAPVLWAYANGITSGMKDGSFGVNEPCTRAQVVTFLYSAYGK